MEVGALDRFLRAVAGAGLILAGATFGAAPASAHAELLSSEPSYGASLPGAPGQVVLRFSEPLELAGSRVELRGPGGRPVSAVRMGELTAERTSLAISLPARLPAGDFVLTFWLLAADSHVMGGELAFQVVPAPAAAPAAPAPTPVPAPVPPDAGPPGPARSGAVSTPSGSPLGGAEDVSRAVGYAALLLLVGGGAFVALIWPQGAEVRRARHLLWAALGVTTLATLVSLGLRGAFLAGLPPARALGPDALSAALGTRFGAIWGVRVLALAAVVPLLLRIGALADGPRPAVRWRRAAAAVALSVLGTYALTGHAADEGAVGAVADLVHLAAVCVWLGGLGMLTVVVVPRRRAGELAEVLPRFADLAFPAVVSLVVAGAAMLVLIGPEWGRLPASGYGRALLVKAGLVALLLLAARSSRSFVRSRLAPRSSPDGTPALGPLARCLLAELAIAAAVLPATAVLVTRALPS